ncbi:MAG: hypothetical protein RL226_1454 [Bacteroidota bacterium]
MRVVLFVGISSVLLASCLKTEEFPNEPVIEFKAFDVSGSGAVLTLSFTDGDGNFGLRGNDTLYPFCYDTCDYYYNLFLEYEELQDGEWTTITLDPDLGQIPFYYRVPWAQPSGQSPTQDGEINVDMPTYFLTTPYDTFRFSATIVDRSLNFSNTVKTDVKVKPD